ncbi:tRNA (adenine(22)-N(1))-methyltransferase [Tepidibacter thalassicus]|uniref:tRNA (Adenine22-N1)-methyltransferase n=1 Tax=Tepidibacter thalassicus DSM 15285 TaxID=1123350 RepID=A0A1M5P3S6_9FIRM|nr:class I SAM-dependent methyltransferase [Tepidibacter thalassicus]SHG96422.1 tRNA (adenine22-N1)-methyltransferase [Tepidibacter thalassicus DSM 15285]
MKLSERLEVIANLVDKNTILADIGTDHGYIPVYLLKNKKIKYAVAADINRGPLENAKKEVLLNNLEDKVDLRLGSGLSVLKKGEVDEVIIAGMGGVLISKILEESFEVAKSLKKIILQPMQASDELRKYLYSEKFEIIDEVLVKEDFRIYEIIVVNYGGKKHKIEDDIYYEIGKKLVEKNDPLLLEFIDKKINEYEKIIKKIEGKEGQKIESRIGECKYKIEKLKELKGNVC